MKNAERIESGDLVKVIFTTSPDLRNAAVLYTPAAEGDCWIVRDENGNIRYIQHFEQILLQSKGIV